MKIYNLKSWIYGLVLSQIVLVVSWQGAFAQDEKIVLRSIPKANNEKYSSANADSVVNVYAAFSSNSEPITENQYLVYEPILPSDTAYLYVAFSVNESTRVEIQWKLKGPEKATIDVGEVGDAQEPGGLLSPSKWYYLSTDVSGDLLDGFYSASVKVKPTTIKGGTASDSCKFEIYSE